MGGAIPNGFELMRGKAKLEKFIRNQIEENGPPKRNIEFNRLIGEMKGSLEMMLILFREHMNVTQISSLEDLLKRYEEFFK